MNRLLRELIWPRGKWTDMFVAVSRLQSERPSKLWAKGECVRTRQDDWIKNDVKIASLFFLVKLCHYWVEIEFSLSVFWAWAVKEDIILCVNEVNLCEIRSISVFWCERERDSPNSIRYEFNTMLPNLIMWKMLVHALASFFFCTLQCVCNVDIMLAWHRQRRSENSSISLLSAHQHVMFGRPKCCALSPIHPMINGNVIETERLEWKMSSNRRK